MKQKESSLSIKGLWRKYMPLTKKQISHLTKMVKGKRSGFKA